MTADPTGPIDHPNQPAWRLLRLVLILWASIVLIRHGSYWGEKALGGGLLNSLMTDPRPLLFAGVEIGTLIMMLLTIVPMTTTPGNLKPVARLAGIFVAANLMGFAFDFFGARDIFESYGLHLLWMIASRLQLLVVPAVAIIAWLKSPRG